MVSSIGSVMSFMSFIFFIFLIWEALSSQRPLITSGHMATALE